ncbi:3-oxoadipate enol-lactonase [Acuticoccus sp. I52.16.1]|uniref:3-oxoadipate enol-lactonase n=1 Tax=Acuticoccus sp. I52.16.1 TaxID=2928472 RepID=UPI001FD09CCE|nr:3-oxoadipate enol-lactonase [Acuticoccus sp. I52.16.1]UOM34405.1 3-oxoadipate enol-lactonase [Acuticoccus sp. I52.16.1]
MRFIKTNGATLHVDHRPAEAGSPTIAFSNSLGTDMRIWDGVVAALPAAWGILRYDTRGQGLSTLSPSGDVATNADDLAGLCDALKLDKVVPCGLSIGGLIVLKFALDHPDRVAGLILTCSGARIGARHDWEARIATVRSQGLAVLGEATMERWFSPAFRAGAADVIDGMRAMLERQPVAGYASLCALLRDTDLTAETGRIAVPTLGIAGSLDQATPPDLLKETVAGIADGTYVELEGLAHIPCVEDPDRLAGAIARFIAEKGIAGA